MSAGVRWLPRVLSWRVAVAFIGCLFLSGGIAASGAGQSARDASVAYSFVTFDPGPGFDPVGLYITKASINKFGHVVGAYAPPPGSGTVFEDRIRGLYRANGVIQTIEAPAYLLDDPRLDEFCRPPGARAECSILHTIPRAINDKEEIVGLVGILAVPCHFDPFKNAEVCEGGSVPFLSFLRSGGLYSLLDEKDAYDITNNSVVLSGDKFSGLESTAMNTSGAVVGYSNTTYNGFFYSAGAFTSLENPGARTLPYGINDQGQIAGSHWPTDSGSMSALVGFPPYRPEDFFTFNVPGSTSTTGYGINSLGQVVGHYYDTQQQKTRFFIATPTSFSNLARLSGVSTRMRVGTGDNVLIGGFIIEGAASKTVVIRARGTSLGVAGALVDPMLTLVPSSGPIVTNDDWQTDARAPELLASGFAPGNTKESALLVTLNPGAYTAIVSGVGNTTGVAIVEVFERDHPEAPLTAISTRGEVQTGDNVMIGGFIIEGGSPQTVVVRARGPSLGLSGTLADPTLTLVGSVGVIASNDDWQSAPNQATLAASGFAPANPKEAAILVTLNPGAYTAIVSGVGSTTGLAIAEVYSLD